MVDDWYRYRWLVIREAQKFHKYNRSKLRGVSVDDLVTTGSFGLYKAATTFDSSRGSFLTWASRKIWSEMRDWVELANRQFERLTKISPATKFPGRVLDSGDGGGTSAIIAKDWWVVTLGRIGYRFSPNHFAIARMMGEGIKSQREIGDHLNMSECAVSQAWKKIKEMVRFWEAESQRVRAA